MPVDRRRLIAENANFYLVGFRRLILVAFVLLGINFFLLGIIFYQQLTLPTIKYFATTSHGRLIEMQPL